MAAPTRRAATMGMAAMMALAAGCADSGVPLAPVSGTVTYNGRPAEAEIVFEPVGDGQSGGGRPSTAIADAAGRFTLAFTADESGAVIGPHRVLIRVLRPDRAQARSLDEATRPLKLVRLERTVQPGRNHFHFALTP